MSALSNKRRKELLLCSSYSSIHFYSKCPHFRLSNSIFFFTFSVRKQEKEIRRNWRTVTDVKCHIFFFYFSTFLFILFCFSSICYSFFFLRAYVFHSLSLSVTCIHPTFCPPNVWNRWSAIVGWWRHYIVWWMCNLMTC